MASPADSSRGPAGMSPKLTTIDLVGGIYCSICRITFKNKQEYDTHYYKHNIGKEEIVYTCVICYKDISGYPSFRGHCYSIHVIKNRFKCEYCSKLFSKSTALKDHIAALHKFQCSSCNREFPSKKELKLHKIIHMNDKPPFKCQTCNEDVDCVDACEAHIDEHSVSLYTCPICNEKINSKQDAPEHLAMHFGNVLKDADSDSEVSDVEKPEDSSIDLLGGVFCGICQTIHKNRVEFDMHFSQDHPHAGVVYGCNICGKQFDKYAQFGNHCYEHISKNRFKCDSCSKVFSRLARLVSHTAAFHGAAEPAPGAGGKPLRCQQPHCRQQFASEFRFREHQRRDHGICVIMCPQPGCGEIFDAPKDLILHQKQHSLANDNWCRHCGLQFKSHAAAERHLPVHRKKIFSCPVCAKKYGEKYLLMKHVPQHFETVIHMCKVCGNVYNAKNRLIEHAKIHANVKNYHCSYCNKGFVSSSKLQQHLNIHTGVKPYKCVACDKKFGNYPNWSKHLQKMHKIDPKTVKNVYKDKNKSNDTKISKLVDPGEARVTMEGMISNDTSELANMDGDIMGGGELMKSYMFLEGEGAEDLDSINPTLTPAGSLEEFAGVLPPVATFVPDENSHVPMCSGDTGIPREYGPDFNYTDCGSLNLDDHCLPHIDPLLTIKETGQGYGYVDYQQNTYDAAGKWEPIITKCYDLGFEGDIGANRLAVMNTDIF